MTKLNDTQLVILSGAARHEDRLVEFGTNSLTASYHRPIVKLISLGFLVEVAIKRGQPTWRTEPSGEHYGLQITDAGLAAIGVETADGQVEVMPPSHSAGIVSSDMLDAPIVRAGSKLITVVDLLRREEGASLGEITDLTNWLPHSARAALTGLRKSGHQIERFKCVEKGTSYRIAALTCAVSSGLGGEQ